VQAKQKNKSIKKDEVYIMPKLKSNSGAKKRFSLTKKGKLKRAKAYKSHLLERKSQKRKRGLRGTTISSDAEIKKVKRMIPYK